MIGVIADDFTGATDVAAAFRRDGLRTVLFFGMPAETVTVPASDAVVVALKSRMAPKHAAVSESLRVLHWLREQHADHVYFKYCSTFDSTAEGNIGPVLEALSAEFGQPPVITTPSSPEHGRTQYMGYLFVGDLLLSDSHMARHPLTPMTDSSLRRLLQAQTDVPVGLIPHAAVRTGAGEVRARVADAAGRGIKLLLADAIDDADLRALGEAALDYPLSAGAAGLAGGLAASVAAARGELFGTSADADSVKLALGGPAAVLAGSCSARTVEQVQVMLDRGHPGYRLDPMLDRDGPALARRALGWLDELGRDRALAPVIYSSADPAELQRVQSAMGVARSAAVLEEASGLIAVGLLDRGVTRMIVAGGETSGAVVTALGTEGGLIGPEAARGVPWIVVSGGQALLLKSGNFGDPDLLADAAR